PLPCDARALPERRAKRLVELRTESAEHFPGPGALLGEPPDVLLGYLADDLRDAVDTGLDVAQCLRHCARRRLDPVDQPYGKLGFVGHGSGVTCGASSAPLRRPRRTRG